MAYTGKLMEAAEPGVLARLASGFVKDFKVGRETTQEIANEARRRRKLPKEMTQFESFAANHPTIYRTREVLGKADPTYKEVRDEYKMGLSDDPATKAGQLLGTAARDIVTDGTRSFYWLINAAQATANIAAEQAIEGLNKAVRYKDDNPINPNLLGGQDYVRDKTGKLVGYGDVDKAIDLGVGVLVEDPSSKIAGKMKLQPTGGASLVPDPTPGSNKMVFAKQNYSMPQRKLPFIATGLGVNTAIGLMNPFGGAEGYKAVLPSDEDPNKTDNVLAEVASKYIMGRTGGLLPYDEFVKVRPDVSKEEYKAYKAYKGSRAADFNPLDGDFNIPYFLKGTDEGIHGAEIDFMGRSIPMNTGLLGIGGSIAGGAVGGLMPATYNAQGRKVRGPLLGATLGSFAGLAAGNTVGGLLETERRRRNQIENEQQIY